MVAVGAKDRNTLAWSIFWSLFNLTRAWGRSLAASRAAGNGLYNYLSNLFALSRGLPLAAIATSKLTKWTARDALINLEVDLLLQALESNHSLVELDLSAAHLNASAVSRLASLLCRGKHQERDRRRAAGLRPGTGQGGLRMMLPEEPALTSLQRLTLDASPLQLSELVRTASDGGVIKLREHLLSTEAACILGSLLSCDFVHSADIKLAGRTIRVKELLQVHDAEIETKRQGANQTDAGHLPDEASDPWSQLDFSTEVPSCEEVPPACFLPCALASSRAHIGRVHPMLRVSSLDAPHAVLQMSFLLHLLHPAWELSTEPDIRVVDQIRVALMPADNAKRAHELVLAKILKLAAQSNLSESTVEQVRARLQEVGEVRVATTFALVQQVAKTKVWGPDSMTSPPDAQLLKLARAIGDARSAGVAVERLQAAQAVLEQAGAMQKLTHLMAPTRLSDVNVGELSAAITEARALHVDGASLEQAAAKLAQASALAEAQRLASVALGEVSTTELAAAIGAAEAAGVSATLVEQFSKTLAQASAHQVLEGLMDATELTEEWLSQLKAAIARAESAGLAKSQGLRAARQMAAMQSQLFEQSVMLADRER